LDLAEERWRARTSAKIDVCARRESPEQGVAMARSDEWRSVACVGEGSLGFRKNGPRDPRASHRVIFGHFVPNAHKLAPNPPARREAPRRKLVRSKYRSRKRQAREDHSRCDVTSSDMLSNHF